MRPAFWIAFPLIYIAVVVGLIALAIPAWQLVDPAARMPEHAVLYAANLIGIGVALEGAARLTRPFKSWLRAHRVQSVLTATILGLGAALSDGATALIVTGAFGIDYPVSSFKAVAVALMTGAFALEWLKAKTRDVAMRPAGPDITWSMADLLALYRGLSRGDRDMLDGALAKQSTEMITVNGSPNHTLWARMAELGWLEAVLVPETLQQGALVGRFRAFAITEAGCKNLPEFIAAARFAEQRAKPGKLAEPALAPR